MPSDSRISSDDAKGNFTNKAQKQDELMVKDTIPLLIGQWIDLVSLKKKKKVQFNVVIITHRFKINMKESLYCKFLSLLKEKNQTNVKKKQQQQKQKKP